MSKRNEKLIPSFDSTDTSTLEDLVMQMAKTFEDSLFQAGANPGVDYTYMDLYKLAQPFALDLFGRDR